MRCRLPAATVLLLGVLLLAWGCDDEPPGAPLAPPEGALPPCTADNGCFVDCASHAECQTDGGRAMCVAGHCRSVSEVGADASIRDAAVDAGPPPADAATDDDAGAASASALCDDTGGRWDAASCGHYACGSAPLCGAVIPGCDCGDGRNYYGGLGCADDANCPG